MSIFGLTNRAANIEAGREEDEVGASASDNQAGDSLNDPRHGSDIGAQSRSVSLFFPLSFFFFFGKKGIHVLSSIASVHE